MGNFLSGHKFGPHHPSTHSSLPITTHHHPSLAISRAVSPTSIGEIQSSPSQVPVQSQSKPQSSPRQVPVKDPSGPGKVNNRPIAFNSRCQPVNRLFGLFHLSQTAIEVDIIIVSQPRLHHNLPISVPSSPLFPISMFRDISGISGVK